MYIKILSDYIGADISEPLLQALQFFLWPKSSAIAAIPTRTYITLEIIASWPPNNTPTSHPATPTRSQLRPPITNRIQKTICNPFIKLYYLLNILLKLDTHYNHESVKKKVLKTINSRNYLLIQDKIKGINLEINRDKQKVIEIIKYLDFDEKYNFFLMDIDKFLNSENPLVNSGMIGNLRAFMEGILGDIAKKIATNNKEEIPRYNHGKEELGWMGRVRQYLKINLDLSEKDHKLIDAYIDILHEEGGHSFISNKDYFRLSRNIGIEIVLLILSKFNQKYPKI